MEVELYKTLDPCVRVVILKALCDIRVEVLLLAAKIMLDFCSFYSSNRQYKSTVALNSC